MQKKKFDFAFKLKNPAFFLKKRAKTVVYNDVIFDLMTQSPKFLQILKIQGEVY